MKYRDNKDKIVFNGDTTIVYGECFPDETFVKKFMKELGAIYYEEDGFNYRESVSARGVAHKDASDVYDKTTGLKVASRKAELKAREKVFRNYMRIYNKLAELRELIEIQMCNESHRCHFIEQELKEVNK